MAEFDPIEWLANARHEFGEHGGVNLSIEASTTFTVMDPETMPKIFAGRLGPDTGGYYLYGRHFNPTVYVLGRQLAALEGTEAGYCTASGMSAIAAVVMQLCDSGDHVVVSNTLYGGTFALFRRFLPAKTGIKVTFVDATDHRAVDAAMTDRTKILFAESVANPTLVVADIPRLAGIAQARGAKLVIDNTFAPMVISPARLGADIVVHSLTKFIAGASDTIAGAICGSIEFIKQTMDLQTGSLMLLGPTMDPIVAFRLSMRIPHIGLRMVEHCRRALEFARRLRNLGVDVIYPGLPSHPQHELLKELHNPEFGYGGLLAVDLGTESRANRFMDLLQNKYRFGYMAVSLGYFDTLMSCSSASTSSELSQDEQAAAGISPGLVRFSIGYTGTIEQRWSALFGALKELGLVSSDGVSASALAPGFAADGRPQGSRPQVETPDADDPEKER
ncbi:MAG: aminotransferase class V-fold PLP-dependent enzyme [Planctomycetota bacterium]|jgi:methionine-gamma-lyase